METQNGESDEKTDCISKEPEDKIIALDSNFDETTVSLAAVDGCTNIADDSLAVNNDKLNDFLEETKQIDENDCILRLVFKNSDAFDELHALISKCIRDTLFSLKKSTHVSVQKDENAVNFLEISAQYDESIFMIDPLPTENTNETEIPDYDSAARNVLNNQIEAVIEAVDPNHDKKLKLNCWNCSGDHNLRDCKEPRDMNIINRAKQMFQKTKTERYHNDVDQKFGHLMPGCISNNLRQALGLRSRELPLYIYKMRLYGYPPGWLEDAKVSHSGLTLFNVENNLAPYTEAKASEVDKITFDSTKFINYPGFNADLPSNIIDDSAYYKVPPMQYAHSKDGLIRALHGNLAKTYKRKKMKCDEGEPLAKIDRKEDDMDIASDEGSSNSEPMMLQPRPNGNSSQTAPSESSPIPTESNVSPLDSTITPNPIDSVEINNESSLIVPDDQILEASTDSNLLSLQELKRKQEEILRALADTPFDQESNSTSLDQNNLPTINADEDRVDESLHDTNHPVEIDVSVEASQNETNIHNTPSTPISGHSKESVFGTPLLKQVSPYSSIPTGEKWSVGVTDVIDFENLPDATGTYNKLSGIIQKVRTVVKRINDENEEDNDL